jgi:hypothetical protein
LGKKSSSKTWSWLSFRHAAKTFAILAMLNFVAFAWALWKRYLPAVAFLRDQPENMRAVTRWMGMWTILLCNASSLTLFGLAFRMGGLTEEGGKPFAQCILFLKTDLEYYGPANLLGFPESFKRFWRWLTRNPEPAIAPWVALQKSGTNDGFRTFGEVNVARARS